MTIYSLDLPISSAVAVALGWTLLHALWQGFALVLPAALLMQLLRHNSSQLRYNVGVSALLGQVILSAATFGWYYQPMLHTVRSSAKSVLATAVSSPVLGSVMSRSLPWSIQVQRFLEGHLAEIVVCWLIGVVVFMVRLAGGWLYVQRLKATALQPAHAFWQAMQVRLSSRLSIRQSVRVLESTQVLVPMVVGALKPVILLPVGLAAGLSMAEAEAILAHELAHIKRFDYGVNLLQSVVEVVYFFHPALWWLSARVREERENCCDDLAVLACGNARSLAQALARVEEFGRTPILAMALASQKKLLLNRVRRMLGVSARPVVSNGHLLVLTLATVLLATVSVYAIQEKQPKPRKVLSGAVERRRLKPSAETEFGITNKRNVDYVVWKGQRLPADRVASLQRQLDKVMAGQLSLDAVKQPDRDILLAIFETGQVASENADPVNLEAATSYRMAEDALATVQAKYDSAMQHLDARLDYKALVNDAVASVQASKAQAEYNRLVDLSLTTAEQALSEQGNTDSLQAIREQNRSKAAVIRLQMEKQRFAVEAIRRKMEIISFDKTRLEQQRLRETMKQRQILIKSRSSDADSARANVDKQIADNERAIQQQEVSIEKNAQQLIDLQRQLDEAEKPIREAETQLRKLGDNRGQRYSVAGPAGAVSYYDHLEAQPTEIYEPTGRTITGSAVISPRTSRPSGWGTVSKPAWPAAAPKPAWPAATTRTPGSAIAPAPVIEARPAMPPAMVPTPRPTVVPKPPKG